MALPAIVGTLLVPILVQILKMATPALRAELEEFIQGWAARCYATPNKWDDVAAKLVSILLSVQVDAKPSNEPLTDAIAGALVEVATGTNPFDPPGNELGGA